MAQQLTPVSYTHLDVYKRQHTQHSEPFSNKTYNTVPKQSTLSRFITFKNDVSLTFMSPDFSFDACEMTLHDTEGVLQRIISRKLKATMKQRAELDSLPYNYLTKLTKISAVKSRSICLHAHNNETRFLRARSCLNKKYSRNIC